jgi:GTPase
MIPININLKQIPNQPPEIYYGNKEYKIKLNYSNKIGLQKKASQMLFRLIEGDGKAIYLLGVEDNGIARGININELIISLKLLIKISNIINSTISKINIYKGIDGYIATLRLFKNIENKISL